MPAKSRKPSKPKRKPGSREARERYKTTIRRGQILAGILEEKTQSQIARELGITPTAVHLHILYLEKYFPELREYLQKYSRQESEESIIIGEKIRAGVLEEKTQVQIAKELNTTPPNIAYYMRRLEQSSPELRTLLGREREKTTITRVKILLGIVFEGKTQAQIARELKISSAKVFQHIKYLEQYYPEIRNYINREKKQTTIRRGKILAKILEGKPKSQIIKELKISLTTFYSHINYLKKYFPELKDYLAKGKVVRPKKKK